MYPDISWLCTAGQLVSPRYLCSARPGLRVSLEIVVCIYDTFDIISGIESRFTKDLRESWS